MIRLKNILTELQDKEISTLLDKINNKQFRFFDQGDNGRVYEIDDEQGDAPMTQLVKSVEFL